MNNYLKCFLQLIGLFVIIELINLGIRYYRTDELEFTFSDWKSWIFLIIVFFGFEAYQTYKKKKSEKKE